MVIFTAYYRKKHIWSEDNMGIKIGIVGYGNLGKGVEFAVQQEPDMELVGIFTRRDPNKVKAKNEGIPILDIVKVREFLNK